MSLRLKGNKKGKKFDTVEITPSLANYRSPNVKKIPSFSGKLPETGGGLSMYQASTVRVNPTDLDGGGMDNNFTSIAEETDDVDIDIDDEEDIDSIHHHMSSPKKFGTFDGVLGRCLLCMWGVIMFLRTGWIVGNAGVWQTTMVMVLSASITMFTTLSLSAICTNGEISHGGPYFLISRSLGPQFGGVIGLLFAIGNCVGVALHLVGFSEAIVSLYDESFLFGWDIVFIAEIGLIFLMLIALKGVGYIIKFNLLLLALMTISIFVFFFGTFFTTKEKEQLGFTGYSGKTFSANWNAAYMNGQNFASMIAIFFPSVTGCMAGANISGDLKNPAVNIPVGTSIAVIFSMVIYVIIAWMLGATVVRELCGDGDVTSFLTCSDSADIIDGTGLYHNYVIMSDISLFRPLVDMGIFASTFSSATSCFVAAPRIFKAVCDDGLFPIFSFFSVGRKSDGEPIRCYILVLIVCFLIMLSGDINFIAPMVTNFFLITYALVNYSVFAWDISKSPGWRPSFKYYHPYLSLFATIQSIVLMFFIDWVMALITVIIGAICYKYIDSRNVDVNWGTTVESTMYLKACKTALKYQSINRDHAKITRPSFLILYTNNNQNDVIQLFNLAALLNYSEGLIIIGTVLIGDIFDTQINQSYLKKRKSHKNYDLPQDILNQSIMECCIAKTYEGGSLHILQLAGFGGMKPNVVMIKINENYYNEDGDDIHDDDKMPLWFHNLTCALLTGCGIIMIPNEVGLDLDGKVDLIDDEETNKNHEPENIDIWWLFDDGGLTILIGYLLTKHKKFKDCNLRIMALDEIGFEDETEMVHLMDKLRINAEIVSVKSNDTMEDEEVDEEDEDTDKAEDEQKEKYVDNDDNDDNDDNEENEENGDNADNVDNGDNEDNEDNADNADNADNGDNGDDGSDSKEKEEKDDDDGDDDDGDDDFDNINYNKSRSKRNVSEFALGKIMKYRKVGKTIEKYSSESKLCLLTMPFPRKKFKWWEYAQIIHDLTPKNIQTIFVRGTQDQVLTFNF